MNEPKICPLLAAGDPNLRSAQCKGDRCAWTYGGECALAAIACSLDGMNMDGITTLEG